MYSNLVDVDERKAVGSFLEDPSKDQRVMNHLDRLQALQMDVGAQMDLFPVKESPFSQQQSEVQSPKNEQNFLTSEIFVDREHERERMLTMFVNDQGKNSNLPPKSENRSKQSAVGSSSGDFSRVEDPLSGQGGSQNVLKPDSSGEALSDADFNLTKTGVQQKMTKNGKGSQSLKSVDFNLTKTGKPPSRLLGQGSASSLPMSGDEQQSVDFNLTKTGGKTLKRANLAQANQAATSGQIGDIYAALAQVAIRSKEVQDQLGTGFSCEDSRVLEVVLEHILFHWEDIVATLLDELIGEEVVEMNQIERKAHQQEAGQETHLADKTMQGKFHDFKSVDLREITQIFEDYAKAEDQIKRYLVSE